jgi:hypothetical protein
MNCNIFRKRLQDYLEGSLQFDLKDAMVDHMHSCEACRKLYEEEKNMDEMLKRAFEIDLGEFKSSRSDILKNIDKRKYGRNPMKKINNHFKKYYFRYISSAAVILFAFIAAPHVMNFRNLDKPEGQQKEIFQSVSDETKKSIMQENGTIGINKDQAAKGEEQSTSMSALENATQDKKLISSLKFTRKELESKDDPKADNITPYKKSEDGAYSVAIEGKGSTGKEEEIGKLLVKDNKSGTKWQLDIADNSNQSSPLYVSWDDNENIFVVIGHGYGTVAVGGDVYRVNIKTGETTSVYETQNDQVQVTAVVRNNQALNLTVRVYKDGQSNEYVEETRTVDYPK